MEASFHKLPHSVTGHAVFYLYVYFRETPFRALKILLGCLFSRSVQLLVPNPNEIGSNQNRGVMAQPNYTRNYETLMAVVTHLGVGKWALRQPRGIANDLSIDESEVKTVLREFKGLFRESTKTSRDHGDHFYSLHLRHSRQASDENREIERAPLESEYLFPLLEFISKKSAQESQQSVAMKVALLTACISLLASAASLIVSLHK
jgi:hypothetical protein